jgi:hypothetical protein
MIYMGIFWINPAAPADRRRPPAVGGFLFGERGPYNKRFSAFSPEAK